MTALPNGPVSKQPDTGPFFDSLNKLTLHGLKTRNGPIIFTGLSEPVITGS